MSGFRIEGVGGAELAVDAASAAARAALYAPDGNPLTHAHGAARDSVNDHGLLLAGVNDGSIRHLRTDRIGSLALASAQTLFSEPFDGATINSTRMTQNNATMAAAQTTAGGIVLNSSSITTANTNYLLRSLFGVVKRQKQPLQVRARARVNHYVNSGFEIGLSDQTSGTGAIANGAYWQYTTGGNVQPVLTFNTSDITGAPVTGLDPTKYYIWDVIVDDDSVVYTIQDSATGLIIAERTINVPLTQSRMFAAARLYAFARLYISASTPATAPQAMITRLDLAALDSPSNLGPEALQALNGMGAHANPLTNAQAAQWANSAAPANATLSNTAAGYTTLGGLFSFAAVAGAATDYALFGFTVPVGHSLEVTGVEIDVWNTGAAVATSPTVMVFGCGIDQAAISLAGTILRRPLGAISLPVATPIGGMADGRIVSDYNCAPLVTHGGRIFTIILRMPVATATASQVIQGVVNVKGIFV